MRDPLPRVQRGLAAALRDRRTQLSAAAFVLTALACYLYVLVGNINNYDNIVCTPEGYGTGLRSGRWMLTLLGDTVGHAMGNFNLPLFNGLLGLAFLGLACQFLWRALHLQKPWQCAVLTAITAAWPAAASAMLFSFTVHYYLFAVLLAAVAVWMADRRGWGWFVGASLTLACSIGVYQAYFPLAAALLVLRLLQQCLDSETPWKTVALRALRFVGVLAAAMVVYFLLLQLCLRLYHETLTAYRGINNMGKLNFAELPQMLVRCVRCFYLLPKTGYAFLTNSRLIRWAMWASLLLSAVSLALAWRDRDWKKIVTVVLLLAALPIAANGIFIMAPETATHTLMTYGVVTLFYLPLIVGDGLRWRRDAVRRWVSLLTCLCLAGASAGYAWFCNGCYRTNYYSNEIMASYYTSMLTRARSMEGYTPDLEIVFVGQYVEDPTLCDLWSGTPFIMGGRSTASGPNTSMPHGVAGSRVLQDGDFVTMDFGVLYQGYCSDMTRTVALGHATEEMRKVYDTVLRAQLAGIAASHAGASGKSVDGAARDIITEAGYGPYFGHSYGHSLGLEIHEAPNCTPRNENPIPAGAVCSAEPGIYIPGKFGVRIEDVVIFREGGCEVITHSPKELTIL